MTPNALYAATKPRTDEQYIGAVLMDEGAFVIRKGHPINYFYNAKDAKAFIFHVYGVSPYEAQAAGVVVIPFKGIKHNRGLGELTPASGHQVVYDGEGEYHASTACTDEFGRESYEKPGFAVLQGKDPLMVLFNAYGVWYTDGGASASGGPSIPIDPADLTLIGLKDVQYQRWSDGVPRADSAGTFNMTVPLWRWTGRVPPSTPQKK